MNPTTNDEDVASDISSDDEDSASEEEMISGSAQTHSVFNLAELALVMDDGDDGFAFFTLSFSLLFQLM